MTARDEMSDPMLPPDGAGSTDPRAAHEERRLTGAHLLLLAGLAALGTLSTNIILPAFPGMGRALGVPSTALAATLSSFFVAFAFGQLVAGPLSDRFGRKWPVLGGLGVFAAGSMLCAAATTLSLLVAGRVLQALGVCAASVLSRAIARDLFDGEALARALSLIMVATAAAPGFSPLVGGTLDSVIGWRGVFGWSASLGSLSPSTMSSPPARRTRPTGARPCLPSPS